MHLTVKNMQKWSSFLDVIVKIKVVCIFCDTVYSV